MRFVTIAAAVAALCLAAPVAASSLSSIATGQGSKIFTTEFKHDGRLSRAGSTDGGKDIFLREGTSFVTPSSEDFAWATTGTVYNWDLSYDGDVANLNFAGKSLQLDIGQDGNWNAFQFYVSARNPRTPLFTDVTTTVNLQSVNGHAVNETVSATKGVNGGTTDAAFWLGGATIADISGTLVFDFDRNGADGSPNSHLAVSIKGLEVAPVPVPAALPLLLAGLGGLAFVGRRRKRA
jgi:hypothetical protein